MPSTPLHALLVAAGAASYDGEARRLIRMGRVRVDGAVAMDEEAPVESVHIAVLDQDEPGLRVAFLPAGNRVSWGATAHDVVPAPFDARPGSRIWITIGTDGAGGVASDLHGRVGTGGTCTMAELLASSHAEAVSSDPCP